MSILDDKTDLDDDTTRPAYYGGPEDPFEPVKVIHAAGLGAGFYYGSALKYLQRTGKKEGQEASDLKKAHWYLTNGVKLGYQLPAEAQDRSNRRHAREVATGWGLHPEEGLGRVVYLILTGRPTQAAEEMTAWMNG